MKCVMRPDCSTYHTYFINTVTGEPDHGVTHQGNRDGSAWARGQAWGVYGIALSYRYLKTPEYLELFCQVTDYFIAHLPEDLVPYWDFDFDTCLLYTSGGVRRAAGESHLYYRFSRSWRTVWNPDPRMSCQARSW